MSLPNFLKSFRSLAEEYVENGYVRDIEFSKGTYQVQVQDQKTGQDVWAFLQLDEKGNIRDSLCSCENGSETSCVHRASAFLAIYNGHPLPLHVRFVRSLWNQLCEIYAERLEYSTNKLKVVSQGHYLFLSPSGKKIFTADGKTKSGRKHLSEILEHRHKETEETSLKFSNLPPEEIALWHAGRPSHFLQYELSFWSDFAKWLMLLQEKGDPYHISFGFASTGIPNWVQIDFSEVSTGFYLSEANLPKIIPSLATVKSPLVVHGLQGEEISEMTYDQVNGILHINHIHKGKKEKKLKESKELPKGYRINGWLYVSNDGFYASEEHSLLAQKEIKGERIARVLKEHLPLVKGTLVGTEIYEDTVPIAYQIFFDEKWQLHIRAYLHEHGDLSKPYSCRFGDWVYLEDEGFYRLEGMNFEQIEMVIPRERLADFVTQNRIWLNTQEGFHTHIVNIESQIVYRLDEKNCLHFESKIIPVSGSEKQIAFDHWIYIEGEGFYRKQRAPAISSALLLAGASIEPNTIPFFIRVNRDELALVPGFFSPRCPVVKMSLNVTLKSDKKIHISPIYEVLPEYQNSPMSFFGDYVYVPDEGFHILPINPRLPEQYRHEVEIEPSRQDLFFEYEWKHLQEFTSGLDSRLMPPKELNLIAQNIQKGELAGQESWFSTKMLYESEKGHVDAVTLWKAYAKGHRFVPTDAGLLDLNEDRFAWLRQLNQHRVDKRKRVLLLSTLDLLRLNAFDVIKTPSHVKTEVESTRKILKEITEFVIPSEPNLTGFETHLRPYQQIGVRWLWFLYHQRLSGLLCDDMGLGKTHQAMGLMAAIRNHFFEVSASTKPHFLVVCPTSVIYHWQDKLRQFFPSLRVCTFYGSKRSLADFHHEYDLLLTSYGIWRLERDLLSRVAFELAIFDEVQMAKNQRSLLHTSLLLAKARMRVGLTGTPIENHLMELKSLFDVVLPTYMPGDREYRDFFVKPIEKENNQKRRNLLSRFIKPFVLRRKKEEVLEDLPEKIEEIAHCPLLPEQQRLYNEVLAQSRQVLLPQLEDKNAPVPYLHVFTVLSYLKRICNHPAVYLKDPENYTKYQSGKWDLFVELLSEARESAQKVVVFSQYLAQLDIIEDYLQKHKIGFAGLRGATVKRGEEVHRFQTDPECEVFVASLHAGGLGIDLTAASVVIHYDRWWNAARENQATDRVHRIGQTKGVEVFKLVTRGTFEEKIDRMIERKGKLLEDVVGADDQQVIKLFGREEILELLKDVEIGNEDQVEVITDQE